MTFQSWADAGMMGGPFQWLASAPQPQANPMMAQFPQMAAMFQQPEQDPRWKTILQGALAGLAGGANANSPLEGIGGGALTAMQLEDQRKEQQQAQQDRQLQQYGIFSDIQARQDEAAQNANTRNLLYEAIGMGGDTALAGVPMAQPQMAGGPLAAGAPPVGGAPQGMPMGDPGADPLAGVPMQAENRGFGSPPPPQVAQAIQTLLGANDLDGAMKVYTDWLTQEPEGVKNIVKIGVVDTPEGPAWQYGDPNTGEPVGPPVLVRDAEGGTSIDFSPSMTMDTGLEPTTSTTTNLQEQVLTSQAQIDNLQGMMALYEPEFLTYLGKGEAAIANILNKLNPEQRSQYAQRAANFEQQTLQFFNAYRKWVTGVAAGEKEIGWLQDSIPSMGDSPQAFESKIQTMIQRTRIVQVRAQMALRAGITPNTDGWREWAAAHPLEGIPSANERGAQLEAQGYSEDQVLELLRQEGY